MAYYALLDENDKVIQVITGIDETESIEGKTPEEWYGKFHNKTCKRTSYNTIGNQHTSGGTPFRGNYAGIGYTYDKHFDVFIPPQPYDSWKLDYTTFLWNAPAPIPEPEEGFIYKWSEINKEWIKLKIPDWVS